MLLLLLLLLHLLDVEDGQVDGRVQEEDDAQHEKRQTAGVGVAVPLALPTKGGVEGIQLSHSGPTAHLTPMRIFIIQQ